MGREAAAKRVILGAGRGRRRRRETRNDFWAFAKKSAASSHFLYCPCCPGSRLWELAIRRENDIMNSRNYTSSCPPYKRDEKGALSRKQKTFVYYSKHPGSLSQSVASKS